MEKSKNTEDLKDNNLIIEVLNKFGVQDKTVEFIRHNENLTLKINGEYLLRIHKSADTFQAINQYVDINIKQLRCAEITFLEHLRKNGIMFRYLFEVRIILMLLKYQTEYMPQCSIGYRETSLRKKK